MTGAVEWLERRDSYRVGIERRQDGLYEVHLERFVRGAIVEESRSPRRRPAGRQGTRGIPAPSGPRELWGPVVGSIRARYDLPRSRTGTLRVRKSVKALCAELR